MKGGRGGPGAWLQIASVALLVGCVADGGDGVWRPSRNVVEDGAVDTGAVDTGALDSRAVDSDALDSGALDGRSSDGNATDSGYDLSATDAADNSTCPLLTWQWDPQCVKTCQGTIDETCLFNCPQVPLTLPGFACHGQCWWTSANPCAVKGPDAGD